MEQDHYQVLGVPPDADLGAIRQAFRRRAFEYHPDRGGSHAEMKRVNLAWEILSDPAARRNYDAARTDAGNRAAQEAAAADARSARERAARYPRRWADFEAWLKRISRDFTDATYGAEHDDRLTAVPVPTVANSASGWVFILVGAALGGILVSPAIFTWCKTQHVLFMPHRVLFLLTTLPPILGGWAGLWIHQCIAKTLGKAPTHRSGGGGAHPQPAAATESRIISCEKCQQKLRVPGIGSELVVTCPACRHRFTHGPA